jgi:arylsulfatase B
MTKQIVFLFLLTIFIRPSSVFSQGDKPNILLVIGDDMGVDVLNGYNIGTTLPTTPTLDSLRAVGITFDNVYSAPKCTPSRAAILSGKYGIKTGVQGTPGNLDLEHTSIFKQLEESTDNAYADAVIGKWHISQPIKNLHAIDHGADYFLGLMGAAPSDYYAWEKTENGVTTVENTYMTTALTDASIDWIKGQEEKPWFLWLAHSAPHMPYHVPPSDLYTISSTQSNFRKYLAMIEAMDAELNRLLYSMPEDVRENTLIIFIGDNGTPGNLTQGYPDGHAKSTVYEGGIRVPMIISGKGVTRIGEREDAMIHFTDLYATILEVAGVDMSEGIYNSLSFDHLFNNSEGPERDYNFSELKDTIKEFWTIRDQQFKLIEDEFGNQEFYDLVNDPLEFDNLLESGLAYVLELIKYDLEIEAEQIRTSWSCRDYIKNGDEEGVDCGGSFCSPCTSSTEDTSTDALFVFPNPSSNFVTIRSESDEIKEIRLLDSNGEIQMIYNNIGRNEYTITLQDFASGVYFIEVVFDNYTEMKKFIRVN